MIFQRRFKPAADRDLIPSKVTPWLLLTLLLSVLLHAERLPVWLIGLSLLLLLWRFWAEHTGARLPGPGLRTLLAVMGIGVFAVLNGRQFAVETALAFFTLTYSLKLLELKSTRDAFLFCCLSLFLLALVFLFGQGIGEVLVVFPAMVVPLQALRSMQEFGHGSASGQSRGRALLSTAKMLGLSLPLLVIFYLFFPRFGPLWSMPLKTTTGFTGLSETMTPGNLSELANRSERAFRVVFREAPPTAETLYWQALILDYFDGVTWSRSYAQIVRDRELFRGSGNADQWDYEVLMDPHNQHWGFTLGGDAPVLGGVLQTPDGLLRFREPVKASTRYRQVGRVVDRVELTAPERARLTRLPPDRNPLTQAWVAGLRQQHGDDRALIRALLDVFREQPFYYSLQPPLLTGADRIDQFLFETRTGFCEHFASSLAYSLRVAGIPTRVMTGYQGGEWNEQGQFLAVHQYDAHAWVEAWLADGGWVRVDPTAAVAPERIRNGLREALEAEGSFLRNDPMALARFSHVAVVNWLRQRIDYTNYLWQNWVVNFDRDRQTTLISHWFGERRWLQVAWIVGILAAVCFLVMAGQLGMSWRVARVTPEVKTVRLWVRRLQRAGLDSAVETCTLQQLAEAAIREWPELEGEVRSLTRALERTLYGAPVPSTNKAQDLHRSLRQRIRRLPLRKVPVAARGRCTDTPSSV